MTERRITIDFKQGYIREYGIDGVVNFKGKLTMTMDDFLNINIMLLDIIDELEKSKEYPHKLEATNNTWRYIHKCLDKRGYYDDVK